jgi:hypothetical protein
LLISKLQTALHRDLHCGLAVNGTSLFAVLREPPTTTILDSFIAAEEVEPPEAKMGSVHQPAFGDQNELENRLETLLQIRFKNQPLIGFLFSANKGRRK